MMHGQKNIKFCPTEFSTSVNTFPNTLAQILPYADVILLNKGFYFYSTKQLTMR